MLDKILLYGGMIFLYFVLYYVISHVNRANFIDIRKVALVKYKVGTKEKYKTIVADKFILKEFIFTKTLKHLNLAKHNVKGIKSIYFFDRNLCLYEFDGKFCKIIDIDKYDKIADDCFVTFLNIYNYLAINRFIGKILFKLDDVKRREAKSLKENTPNE